MPTTQLQLRRGNTAQTAVFTGAVGEVTVDTEKKTLIVHDGTTVGGTEIALKSRVDASYTAANSAGSYANAAYSEANTAYNNAVTSDQRAVTSGSYANSAYSQANTATTNAVTADQRAVTSGSYANSAYLHSNSSFIVANTANAKIYISDETLSTNTANQTIDTYAISDYRTAKYIIQAISGSGFHTEELLVTHDDTSVYFTEYASLNNSGNLFSVYATIQANNVTVNVSPLYANTQVDFSRTALIARTILPGLQGDLMSMSGIEDLLSSSGLYDLNI